ncbi:MAG: hypothetical protein GX860_04250 [Alcaligenaceae bacterium]|nr:hypothetical protein [Alcaligenaceae bacterium]
MGLLSKPREGYIESLSEYERDVLNPVMACTVIGDREWVAEGLRQLIAAYRCR